MEKKKYYISIGTGEISEVKYGNNDEFVVYATMEEIRQLRQLLNGMDQADFGTYVRAHFPFVPYHKDEENDQYDEKITEAYKMIHQLGDETTKRHIESIGILDDDPL